MQSQEEEFVITKFKRHGHPITRKSLDKTISWLRQSTANSLDTLLKKLNQLALENSNTEHNLQHALQILSVNNKKLNSYEDLLEETRKRCIYAISPYEYDINTWFVERPQPLLFEFRPEQQLKNSQAYFKRLGDANKELSRSSMMGIIYENYSLLDLDGKQKLLMQNEVNQVQVTFRDHFSPSCLIIPGCTYIAEGHQDGKDLSYKVQKIALPSPPIEQKNPLLKQKFKQMCQNIGAGKQTLGFEPFDFVKYDCVYTPVDQALRPTLIFGNVTINPKSVERLRRLVEAYPKGLSCLILMLSGGEHQSIDLSVWLKCKVYLIPHIASDGPRHLPKLPLLKVKIPGAKVLTNPARLSLEGRQLVIANYPLLRTVYSQSVPYLDIPNITQQEIGAKVSELLFSQGTIAMGGEYYWPQHDYFNIHLETIVVVCDSIDVMSFYKSGKIGGLANTGNFQRDGDFLCLMSWAKSIVQFSGQPKE